MKKRKFIQIACSQSSTIDGDISSELYGLTDEGEVFTYLSGNVWEKLADCPQEVINR